MGLREGFVALILLCAVFSTSAILIGVFVVGIRHIEYAASFVIVFSLSLYPILVHLTSVVLECFEGDSRE